MNKCLNCGELVLNKYCNVSCQNKHQGSTRANKKYGLVKDFKVKCHCCNTKFIVQEREKLFPQKEKYSCSRSCSNKKKHSEETKNKISKTLREKERVINIGICLHCKKEFIKKRKKQKLCSRSCASSWRNTVLGVGRKAGLASAKSQSETRRSRNEIHFAKLCSEYFDEVLTNKSIFNGWDADVVIEDIKVAVLWNGLWHYEKITESHSVKQVQNRDKIKIKEIKLKGYVPYVIKDMGKENKKFVEK